MSYNDKPSLKRKPNYDKKRDNSINVPKIKLGSIPPISRKNLLIIIAVVFLLLFMIFTVNTSNNENSTNNTTNDSSELENVLPTTILLGNNSLGSVYKEGPYGNTNSDIKIAYIIGVHPREKGAHQLLEEAFKEKVDNTNYCYYLYRVNVTENPTDFSESRLNGQKLANSYIVPDAISNNITFAVDCHYSNGAWGVERFVFTPRENNTLSSDLGHAISDNFDWLTYYTPPNPSSPEYVTGPLNNGGVSAIIYEAYTEDNSTVTLEHDKELIDFIDNWNFTSSNNLENNTTNESV